MKKTSAAALHLDLSRDTDRARHVRFETAVYLGDALEWRKPARRRMDAECAFAEALVRAQHKALHDGGTRRVELRAGAILLDVARVGPGPMH